MDNLRAINIVDGVQVLLESNIKPYILTLLVAAGFLHRPPEKWVMCTTLSCNSPTPVVLTSSPNVQKLES